MQNGKRMMRGELRKREAFRFPRWRAMFEKQCSENSGFPNRDLGKKGRFAIVLHVRRGSV